MRGLLITLFVLLGANGGDGRHFIRIDPGHWAAREPMRPAHVAPGEVIWTWSAACPPAVVSAETAELPCPAAARLSVQVKDPKRRPAHGVRVIWTTKELSGDIPDDLLPAAETDERGVAEIAAPAAGALYVRVAGSGLVSNWSALRRDGQNVIVAMAASEVAIEALDAAGRKVPHVRAMFSPVDVPSFENMRMLLLAEEGRMRVLLPRAGTYRGVFWSDTQAPLERTAPAAAFAGTVVLPDGAAVRGAVVDAEAKPVAGARVDLQFALPGGRTGWRRNVETGPDGAFQLRGIPSGITVLSILKNTFAAVRRELTLPAGTNDLGRLELAPARAMRVSVVDAATGRPVAQARVRAANGVTARSGTDGIAILGGLGGDEEVALAVHADDYLDARTRVPLVSKAPPVVKIERGALISGRVVSAENGKPLGPGSIWVDLAGSKSMRELGPSGELHVGALTAGALDLEVRVPGYAPHKLPKRQLAAGEQVDLGRIVLDAGHGIRGAVVDGLTREPLAGATIRIPRPNLFGPRLSLVMNDWVQTTTDEEGRFRVAGLGAGDYRLLVAAAGHAPTLTKPVTLGPVTLGDEETDVGQVELSAAHELRIRCRPARRCGNRAEVLLGDANDDWAALQTVVTEGRAELQGVPEGTYPLRISRDGAVIVEKEIEIRRDDGAAEARIELPEIAVRGDVVRAGRTVRGGSLQFVSRRQGGSMPIMLDRRIGDVTVESVTIGTSSRAVAVPVDGGGAFATSDLSAGEYQVSYSGEMGDTPPQMVVIPDASSFSVHLQYAGSSLAGSVADERGKVPEWAQLEVRTDGGTLTTDVGPDGRFRFDGVPPGRATLRAWTEAAEGTREVTLDEGKVTETSLVLNDRAKAMLHVKALGPEGAPLAGATLFLLCDGALKTATSDGAGGARISITPRPASCIGAAFAPAYGWAFAPQMSMSAGAPGDLELRFSSRRAAILVESSETFAVSVLTPSGFPLDRVFAYVGWPSGVTPRQPLQLRGLPPGSYAIGLRGGEVRTVSLDGTRDATLKF